MLLGESLRAVLADDTFAKRFQIEDEAGSGGMGLVHKAIDRSTGKPIALKVLRTPGLESRFTLEAEMLERLEHPAIVAYVGHGVTTGGDAYLAMAWLEGTSLAQRLKSGALSIDDTLSIGVRIASALVHAHGQSIVHRDVKPSNVMLVDDAPAQATLIDFGIAKDTAVTHGLTETGQLIGTPGYMAPEQAMGHTAPTASMDLFGLGAVLYECLAGRPPFEGRQTMEVLAQLLLHDPVALPDTVPPRLAALVTALLAKEPEHRLADAARTEVELTAIAAARRANDTVALAEIPDWIPKPPARPSTKATLPAATAAKRKRSVWPFVLAGVLGSGGLALVLALVFRRGPVAEPPEAVPRAKHPCESQGAGACKAPCGDGNAFACRIYGREVYLAAKGDDVGQRAGLDILGRACTLGDPQGCSLAGTWTRRQVTQGDTSYTREQWVALFTRGCELKDGTSCSLLADHLLAESPANQEQALALYEQGCAVENLASCFHASELLQNRGEAVRAAKLRAHACEKGFTRACTK